MSKSWDLKSLREYIRTNKGEDPELLDLVRSVDNSINIFRYHLFTARDSLNKFFSPDEKAKPEHLKLILGASEFNSEYALAKTENEANTIAAIYTIRSLYDLFSQLVRGLILANSLSVEKCNIHRVKDKLPPSDLKTCLDELLLSDGFMYINAFANVSKHRCLVKFGSLIDIQENKAGVKFYGFTYGNKQFDSMWSYEILELILKTKNVIIDAGNCLNKLCIDESI